MSQTNLLSIFIITAY